MPEQLPPRRSTRAARRPPLPESFRSSGVSLDLGRRSTSLASTVAAPHSQPLLPRSASLDLYAPVRHPVLRRARKLPPMPIFDEPLPMAESSQRAAAASASKPFAGFRRAAGLLRKQRSEANFGSNENRGASSSSRSSGSTRSSPFDDDAEPAPVAPTTSTFESWEGDEATPKGPGRILKRSPRKNENDLRQKFFGSGAGRGSGRQRSESVGDRGRVKGSVLLGMNSNQVMGRNLEAAIDQAGSSQGAMPSMPTPRASRTAQASPWSSQLAAPFPDAASSSSVYSQHHGAAAMPRIGSTDSLELLALDFPPPPPVSSAPVRPQLRGSASVGALRKSYRLAGGVGTGRTSLEIMADTISPSPLPLRTRRGVDPLSISLAQVAAGGPSRRRTTVRSPHGVHSPPPCPPPSTPLPEVPLTPAFEYASFSARSSALQSPGAAQHSRTASSSSGAGGETKDDSRSRASTQTAISDYGDSELSYGCDSATSSGSSPFTPLTPLDRGGLELPSEEATPSKAAALGALDFDLHSLQSPVLFSLSNALDLDAPRGCAPAVMPPLEDDDAVYGYAM